MGIPQRAEEDTSILIRWDEDLWHDVYREYATILGVAEVPRKQCHDSSWSEVLRRFGGGGSDDPSVLHGLEEDGAILVRFGEGV